MEIEPITVSDLNRYVKQKIDNDEFLNNVYVRGEISNCKLHYTGHIYFTLKDENSLIKCVMFKSYTPHLTFIPKDGMKVMVFGSVSVFERDGAAEGLFDESHKKAIPQFPNKIGVLTASTGAVIRDIINVSTRRNPNVHIVLLPVPVQGPTAAEAIVKGIKKMNDEKMADVIILGRGGGSLEDLWPFNEEIDSISSCRTSGSKCRRCKIYNIWNTKQIQNLIKEKNWTEKNAIWEMYRKQRI